MEQQAAPSRAAVQAGETPTLVRSHAPQPRRAAQVKKINPFAKDSVTGRLNYMALRPHLLDGDLLLFRPKGIHAQWRRLKDGATEHIGIVARWGERVMVFEETANGVIARPLSPRLEAYVGQVELYKPHPSHKLSSPQRLQARDELLARLTAKPSWRQWLSPQADGVELAMAVYQRADAALVPPDAEAGHSVARTLLRAPQLARVGLLK